MDDMKTVKVPLIVTAAMTFRVGRDVEVTDELIQDRILTAQRHLDHRGDDPVTGIYVRIESNETPEIEGGPV